VDEDVNARIRQLGHDLRSPLNAVLGFAALLEQELEGTAADDAGRIREAAEHMVEIISQATVVAAVSGPPRTTAQPVVLVVEDHEPNVELVRRILRHRPSVALEAVSTVDAAIDLLDGGLAPAVVLLDLHLQGQDGRAFLDQLGEREPRPPVVVVSADPVAARAEASREGGAQGYLAKPYSVGELLAVVDRYCPLTADR
jgi:CheY-like chemotaxis protein